MKRLYNIILIDEEGKQHKISIIKNTIKEVNKYLNSKFPYYKLITIDSKNI